MNPLFMLKIKLSALSIYHGLLKTELFSSLYDLMGAMDVPPDEFALRWGRFFSALSSEESRAESLSDAIYNKVVYDDNVFTRAAAGGEAVDCDSSEAWSSGRTMEAVRRDLATLRELSELKPDDIINAYPRRAEFGGDPFALLPEWECGTTEITTEGIVRFHMTNGCGEYAKYIAFVRRNGKCVPIASPDLVSLDTLTGYEVTRKPVVDNTVAFLDGLPANNCLLFGDRGTGKSSTVKALLNEYCDRGLRLIELPKKYLSEYPDIVSPSRQATRITRRSKAYWKAESRHVRATRSFMPPPTADIFSARRFPHGRATICIAPTPYRNRCRSQTDSVCRSASLLRTGKSITISFTRWRRNGVLTLTLKNWKWRRNDGQPIRAVVPREQPFSLSTTRRRSSREGTDYDGRQRKIQSARRRM